MASFGQRFKELRQEKNLTQEKLAEEFFLNKSSISRYILGQPAMMNYGGYDLKDMPEEEILEIANDILLTLRISIERRKQKK